MNINFTMPTFSSLHYMLYHFVWSEQSIFCQNSHIFSATYSVRKSPVSTVTYILVRTIHFSVRTVTYTYVLIFSAKTISVTTVVHFSVKTVCNNNHVFPFFCWNSPFFCHNMQSCQNSFFSVTSHIYSYVFQFFLSKQSLFSVTTVNFFL